MVSQPASQSEQKMSPIAYVEDARKWAAFLEDRESALSLDRDAARRRLQARYGIAGTVFYSLRYRPPKVIAADIYHRLAFAVEDVCRSQIRMLETEIEIVQAARGHRDRVVTAARAIVAASMAILEDK